MSGNSFMARNRMPDVSEMGFEDDTGIIVIHASFPDVYMHVLVVVGDSVD